MQTFEWILILLVSAVCLTALARRINVPYPSLLALGLLVAGRRFRDAGVGVRSEAAHVVDDVT